MSSTMAEMFSDFRDMAKLYTETLDVTELAFMRWLTKGIQIFQRETEYVEQVQRIDLNADNIYMLPTDVLRIIELRNGLIPQDEANYPTATVPILIVDFEQFTRIRDTLHTGVGRTPNVYMYHYPDKSVYIATVWRQEILIYPQYDGPLYLWYIPDLSPLSATEQWIRADDTTTVPITYNSWYPLDQVIVHPITGQNITRFMYQFSTKRLNPVLSPYENAFIDYALSWFIKSKGSANYRVFEQSFKQEIERAKVNKPTLFQQGIVDYKFAPFS